MRDDRPRRRWWLVGGVVLGLAACSGNDGSSTGTSPSRASTSPASTAGEAGGGAGEPSATSTAPTGGLQPTGFSTVTARITDTDGAVCEVCLWLADTAEERSRGLMGVTDLGDASGMAFVFEQPTAGSFYMFQTLTPLSIAWFAPDGSFVDTAEMAPCVDTPAAQCARYAPEGQYDLAIETFAGGLDPLGIGPGATAVLVAGTEAEECVTVGVVRATP